MPHHPRQADGRWRGLEAVCPPWRAVSSGVKWRRAAAVHDEPWRRTTRLGGGCPARHERTRMAHRGERGGHVASHGHHNHQRNRSIGPIGWEWTMNRRNHVIRSMAQRTKAVSRPGARFLIELRRDRGRLARVLLFTAGSGRAARDGAPNGCVAPRHFLSVFDTYSTRPHKIGQAEGLVLPPHCRFGKTRLCSFPSWSPAWRRLASARWPSRCAPRAHVLSYPLNAVSSSRLPIVIARDTAGVRSVAPPIEGRENRPSACRTPGVRQAPRASAARSRGPRGWLVDRPERTRPRTTRVACHCRPGAGRR